MKASVPEIKHNMSMVKSKEWISCSWNPSDKRQENEICDMYKANHFDFEDRENEYFDWKHRRNPAGRAIIRLAVANGKSGRIVGIYCVIPILLICNSETIRVAMSVGTLTDTRYRGQGIFTSLAKEVYNLCSKHGLHAVLGYPNQNSYKGFIGHLDFKDIYKIPLLVRILRLSNIVKRRFIERKWMPFASAMAKSYDLCFKVPKVNVKAIEEVTYFDQAFDELNEHLSMRFPIFVKRDSVFLNWRYFDNPFNYRVLAIRRTGKILGYLVYRFIDFAKMRCGIVLDFIVRKGITNIEVGRGLIRNALNDMRENDCDIAGTLCLPNTTEFRILKQSMFFNCPSLLRPQPYPYIIRRNETAFEFDTDLFEIGNWYVSIGDYDAA